MVRLRVGDMNEWYCGDGSDGALNESSGAPGVTDTATSRDYTSVNVATGSGIYLRTTAAVNPWKAQRVVWRVQGDVTVGALAGASNGFISLSSNTVNSNVYGVDGWGDATDGAAGAAGTRGAGGDAISIPSAYQSGTNHLMATSLYSGFEHAGAGGLGQGNAWASSNAYSHGSGTFVIIAGGDVVLNYIDASGDTGRGGGASAAGCGGGAGGLVVVVSKSSISLDYYGIKCSGGSGGAGSSHKGGGGGGGGTIILIAPTIDTGTNGAYTGSLSFTTQGGSAGVDGAGSNAGGGGGGSFGCGGYGGDASHAANAGGSGSLVRAAFGSWLDL